jgi:hypothetical protein
MKKFFSFISLLLFSVSVLAQNLTPKEVDNAYLVFRRPDGINTYYRINKLTVFVDQATIGRKVLADAPIELSGFEKQQELTTNIFDLLPKETVNVPQPQPTTISIPDWLPGPGQYKVLYGSNYQREKAELPGGKATFNFYGQNITYPPFGTEKPSSDEAVVMAFPTHSIINFAGLDFVSSIHMKLTDENNNLVWELLDTKGGYHAVLKDNARGNNHPDDANRWIRYGRYKLWVKNLSTDARAVQTITFGTTKGIERFTHYLLAGMEETFDLNIIQLVDAYDLYKLNCNVFTNRR